MNEKLHELEAARASLAELERAPRSVSTEDRERLLSLGRDFPAVWRSEHCPMELKKKIVRTLVEEVIAHVVGDGQRLRFFTHWSGGAQSVGNTRAVRSSTGLLGSTPSRAPANPGGPWTGSLGLPGRISGGVDPAPRADIRHMWNTALKAAGLPSGRLFHDLRRSAVRTLIRSGVDPSIAMKVSGHKTRSMLDRYNIIAEDETAAAFTKADR